MTTKQENQAHKKGNAVGRFMKSSYAAMMQASEDLVVITLDMPVNIIEGMGAEEERVKSLKERNRQLAARMYGTLDSFADKGKRAITAPFRGVGYLFSKVRRGRSGKAAADVKITPKPKAKTDVMQAAAPKKVAAASESKKADKGADLEAAA